MIIGFTGTRSGATDDQASTLYSLLVELLPTVVHHGCCVGADTQFALLASTTLCRPKIHGHPSDILPLTSRKACMVCDELDQPQPALSRNRAIVDASEVLIVVPEGWEEKQRSGTWATYRYARKTGKKIIIVYPDGSSQEQDEVAQTEE